MNPEQRNDDLYALVYSLITELESLKTSNALLLKENIFLKQQLEKYQTPKNSGNSSKPPSSDFFPRYKRPKVCAPHRVKSPEDNLDMKVQP
jgi:hypothetical protein